MRPEAHNRESDVEVARLIRALESLVDGQSAIDELVACGSHAISALRSFLLHGRIVSVPQPRMWATEALARLGARDVLMEYLEAPDRSADAQLSFAEDAVRNTAARHLGNWHDERTFEALLGLCQKRLLPGVVEAIAGFDRIEAIPCLDRALEDDFCRAAAEEGLRRIGLGAFEHLILSAMMPLPNATEETPSSLGRRRRILAILAETDIDARNWSQLRLLLSEPDPELLVGTARIAARAAGVMDRAASAAALVNKLPGVPWHAWKDAEEALIALAPESSPAIEAELSWRAARPPLLDRPWVTGGVQQHFLSKVGQIEMAKLKGIGCGLEQLRGIAIVKRQEIHGFGRVPEEPAQRTHACGITRGRDQYQAAHMINPLQETICSEASSFNSVENHWDRRSLDRVPNQALQMEAGLRSNPSLSIVTRLGALEKLSMPFSDQGARHSTQQAMQRGLPSEV